MTLNRPDKLNALNSEMVTQLEEVVTALDADETIGAIVITGAGDRAFSSGGDMAEQVAALEEERTFPRLNASLLLHEVRTPTIAAIRGYCFGGGALLAIHCDIRIGGEDARLKFHGASYGRAPGAAVLPRIVGEAKAKELLFTGDEIRATEALRIGLLNQVVAPEAVLQTAVAMAQRIVANSPAAVRALKEIIERALPVDKALEYEHEVNQGMGRTPDSAARFRSAAERVLGLRNP
ncbi:MAG: enoyl-CoA hydratase/isomerase family protein [Chloroflexi bacterium]|nr:enoyl-CoA hydratase/isomerase family protein [Chloroflexota bacterium]